MKNNVITKTSKASALESEANILNHELSQITALAIIAYQRANIEQDESLYYLLGVMVDTLFNTKRHILNRMNSLIEKEAENA